MFDTELVEEIYAEHSLEIGAFAILLLFIITIRIFQPTLSVSFKMPAASPQTVSSATFH